MRLSDNDYLRLALRLARKGLGCTSPNPAVGAVLVKRGEIIGRGWHHSAGQPHAEIEALRDAESRGHAPSGATLYVTLEPCCTHGRTPPCTEAIIRAKIRKVVVGATDPNPDHCGKGLSLLRNAGVSVVAGVLVRECERLNEAFNYWIVHRCPFVTVKAAMTLDGRIATATGESKWITGEKARARGMELRGRSDAILVGVNTVLADDPSLTWRRGESSRIHRELPLRRIVLDSRARTLPSSKVVSDERNSDTTIVVTELAPRKRLKALADRVDVLVAPSARSRGRQHGGVDLRWLLKRLGQQDVTSLLVEGGGEVNASFLLQNLAHRVAFFYAPIILGGHHSIPAVGGEGAASLSEILDLTDVEWRKLGLDWFMTARVSLKKPSAQTK